MSTITRAREIADFIDSKFTELANIISPGAGQAPSVYPVIDAFRDDVRSELMDQLDPNSSLQDYRDKIEAPLLQEIERAKGHLKDVLANDDGQAWKEAERYMGIRK